MGLYLGLAPKAGLVPSVILAQLPVKGKDQMTCHNCRNLCQRYGKDRNGYQRWQCLQCGKVFVEPHERPFEAMYTGSEKGFMALKLLLGSV